MDRTRLHAAQSAYRKLTGKERLSFLFGLLHPRNGDPLFREYVASAEADESLLVAFDLLASQDHQLAAEAIVGYIADRQIEAQSQNLVPEYDETRSTRHFDKRTGHALIAQGPHDGFMTLWFEARPGASIRLSHEQALTLASSLYSSWLEDDEDDGDDIELVPYDADFEGHSELTADGALEMLDDPFDLEEELPQKNRLWDQFKSIVKAAALGGFRR